MGTYNASGKSVSACQPFGGHLRTFMAGALSKEMPWSDGICGRDSSERSSGGLYVVLCGHQWQSAWEAAAATASLKANQL